MVAGIDQREGPEAVRAFARRHDLTYPVLLDPGGRAYHRFTRGGLLELIPLWRIPGPIPYNVVIDRSGIVRYARVVPDRGELTRLVEQLISER